MEKDGGGEGERWREFYTFTHVRRLTYKMFHMFSFNHLFD